MKLFADEENLGLGFRLIEIKAKDALRILGHDDIEYIKDRLYKGGLKK